jgi:hypothetical protein
VPHVKASACTRTNSSGDPLLYDLATDPRESRDLAAERPADLDQMLVRLAAVQSQIGVSALDAPLSDEDDAPELATATQQSLRALGYIE